MEKRLSGKTAVITGGGNGIGREMARTFAAQGARVISLDLDEPGNRLTAAQVESVGGECLPLRGDVSMASDVERAFRIAGPVDILVNNAAAWAGDGFLLDVTETAWDHVLAVSLKGVFLCCRAAVPGMLDRRSGAIINISSVNALMGISLAAYTAAKGGVVSLTKVLALQYGAQGIRVNCICPGTIMTESSQHAYPQYKDYFEDLRTLYPAGEYGTPRDVAELALFLASDQAKFMNGSVIAVDGALSAVHNLPSCVAPSPKQG